MNLQLVYRYILSLSKNESMFYEKYKKTKTKTKGPKKKTEKYYSRQVLNPRPPTCYLDTLPIAPRKPVANGKCKFIAFKSFAIGLIRVNHLSSNRGQDEFVNDNERRRVRSGSRTLSKAGKTNV